MTKNTEQILLILKKYGRKAFEYAQNFISQEKRIPASIYKSLLYFLEQIRSKPQIFPALISLSCDAVGGNPEKTAPIGAAMILLAGAADIHDDLIDKSRIKYSKKTVYGKFGEDIALLTGDALFLEGFTLLFRECNKLSKSQSEAILNSVKRTLIEIGSAESLEIEMRGRYDISPREYYNLVEMKASFAEACTRLGAILGNGSSQEIEALAHYGRVFGILATMRDDFIDIYEPQELQNRLKNECLPLPIISALQDDKIRERLLHILDSLKYERNIASMDEIKKLVMECEEVRKLREKMLSLVFMTTNRLQILKKPAIITILNVLLHSTIEGI